MKKPCFPDDTYDTPENTSRSLLDRLLLGSRWGFYLKFIRIVLKSRSYAVKGIYDDERWIKTSFDVFKAIEQSEGRFHIRGINNLHKTNEPLVIISNHMSSLETVVFPCIIAPFRRVTYVVKEELIKARIFGPIMRSRNPIVVGRKDPRKDLQAVLNDGPKLIREGYSIVIFPQSTRYIEFNPDNFNSLGVKLARRAGVKALPVAIKTNFWGNGKRIRDLGPIDHSLPIHMVFGEPMPISGNGSEEHKKIINFIQANFDKWSKEI